MAAVSLPIDPDDGRQLWALLAEEGKAPTELAFAGQVLPSYSVAIGPWLDRIAKTYLTGLSTRHAHFKLVIAPYGGGKTHFLVALGSRGLSEGLAVAYVACTRGVSLDSPLDVYRAYAKAVQLPGEQQPGLKRFLRRVLDQKKRQIATAGAPDPDAALAVWLDQVAVEDFPENAFGRVMAEALRWIDDPSNAAGGEAAIRWLQGDADTLTKEDLAFLKLARVPGKAQAELGRNLLLSMLQFCRAQANVKGTVILFDEVETLFNATGKALQRVLSAMRVMIDVPAGVSGGVALLGVFSAVPDVLEQLSRYPALEQRLAVKGATFEEGNDFSIQVRLEHLGGQEEFLRELGGRLVELGAVATGRAFNSTIQKQNVETLARVAAQRSLQVDARRLFVKACVNILALQAAQGEKVLSEDEMASRYAGFFDSLRESEDSEQEP